MKPTRWLVLRVPRPQDEDRSALLAEALLAVGGRAVWEEGETLLTHLLPPQDPAVPEPLSGARPEGEEASYGDFGARVVERLRGLAGMAELEVETDWQLQEDWAQTWRRGLVPRRITHRLVVTPSWERPEAGPDDVVLVLDPGMAFGNAEHGTTRGCLRLLDRAIAVGQRVMDVGAGSGILSIAAARLGARKVVAVEGDPLAWETLEENVLRNGVGGKVVLRKEWASCDSLAEMGRFDGVLANIEAGVLLRLLPGVAQALAPGGWLVLSGLGEEDVEPLQAGAHALGLETVSLDADGEWRSLLLTMTS